ncbi:MAG TPA: type II toxin-antitoxin system RelE/ParE family toxin [Candidatus Binatia bacterium]|nr:type II toxin-antitoxin system RelE/ParE family toxin [Candidatus Binatia bacterium]
MKRLGVDPAAEEELRAAVAWYEMQRRGLGARFFTEVGRVLDLILRHPGIGSPVPRVRAEYGTRRVPLRRFPYFVVYREQGEEIHVVAVAHASRKPGYWRHR